MEQPPGSFDDLQPQDLSTSGLPTVIDLTRKGGEERVLNPASLDALRMVGSPGWYPVPGAADPGLPYSESASSDVALQAGDQIQPDNAFSHTTVTLSYVSRSHVFTAHDSLSHSALYSVPPISKFSLHPPCDADKGLGESGYALNQHYLAEEEGPVDLATQTELFQPPSQTQTGEHLVQEPHELNGGVASSDGDVEMSVRGDDEHRTSLEKSESLENGQGDRWSSSGVCADSSPETPAPLKEEEEVLFLLSKKRDPGAGSEGVDARNLCLLRREYISPLEDPVSPSATSLDDVEDVFVLPQASCSPSGDASYLEEIACDGSGTEGGIQASSGIDDDVVMLDSSEENKQPTRKRTTLLEPLIDLTDDVCLSDLSENKTNTSEVVPHVNGNVKVLERTLTERKLPMRSGRGTRLEAIVMNINSSRYRVSGCVRSSKKTNASQSARSDSSVASPKKKDSPSVVKQKGKVKASPSVKTRKRKTSRRRQSNHINNDCCKSSTSDSDTINNVKKSHSSPPPKSPQFTVHTRSKKTLKSVPPPATSPRTSPLRPKRTLSSQSSPASTPSKKSNKEPELEAQPGPSVETHEAKVSPPPLPQTSPKKSSDKAKSKSPSSKSSPPAKAKASRTPKRRRKKQKQGRSSSSMFSPKEPEIKLKYVSYKEERRDSRLDSFSPFIHVERKQCSPSLCTVINYPDEVQMQHKKGQQQAPGSSFVSAAVPSTSCLRLGRVSTHSQHQRSLVCCICGQSANAMDLGDLHGPYYPEGYRPNAKAPATASGLKAEDDDDSDSDSSAFSMKGRGRKRAAPPAPWAVRPGAQLKQKGVLPDNHRWTGDGTGSPVAKQARSEPGSAVVEDWYSPPMLPLEPCEHWLHEDCGIWSAGVFLVKGKVYGLEEAVKAAQETVCSACHSPGATLGCLFKGCPNKYHYRCALESDCVLIEENFSMKCKKHKNKTFKGSPGNRWNDR